MSPDFRIHVVEEQGKLSRQDTNRSHGKTVSPKANANWEETVSNDHIWEAGQERTAFEGDKKPPEQEPWN